MSTPSRSPREAYQAGQARQPAPYAVREADSSDSARKHPEDEHSYRTCFQRDRARIVHCSAFRRLDFKTQVFVPHEQDHFRTRLTHTLEVAQIGRDLGRALGLNEDLIEAVALAHDLGHSPFGHAGEEALDELMADCGGFEHNRQSLRVVDYLEHPYPEFRGLNLTRAVRECIARHETRYDTPACEDFEAGAFAPIEGQLVDLADEIAYTSADLDDALASGWIAPADLSGCELWRRAWRQVEAHTPGAREIHKRIRATKAILAIPADDLLDATRANIGRLGIDSAQAARRAQQKCVAFSPGIRAELDQVQEFLLNNVYCNPLCMDRQRASRTVVRELFAAYTGQPALLPKRYQRRIDGVGLERVVCDYVAGMTDRFCQQEHQRIRG